MLNKNIKTWTKMLRSGTYRQGQGALARRDIENNLHFCCLGVGCKMINLPMAEHDQHGNPLLDIVFITSEGHKVDGHAPADFHRWLGLIPQDAAPEWDQSDIYIDTPDGFFVRDVVYQTKHILTCAELNDGGLTFSQIADVIDYFGLRETDH